MQDGQIEIFELFNVDRKFIIPQYQRAYAWGVKQRKEFLHDIENQRSDKKYFMGTILFEKKPRTKGYDEIHIVDGQQRVTTLIIFLNELLKRLRDLDKDTDYSKDVRKYIQEDGLYRLEVAPMDNEFFRTYILDDLATSHEVARTPSQKRLLEAKKFFADKLRQYPLEKLRAFKQTVEHTKILIYSVSDTADATLIFETTNDRGKSLTNLEKTKSFLMHKIYLTAKNPHERLTIVQDRFAEIYRILQELDSGKDEEDSYLQYHFIGHFNWKATQKSKDFQAYTEKMKEHVNKLAKINNGESVPTFVDNYTRELKESFFVITQIMADKDPAIRDLIILDRMSLFLPLLIKCYKLDKSSEKEQFHKVARLLEMFSLRVLGIGGKPAYTGRDWFYRRARDFKGGSAEDFAKLYSDIARKIVEYVNDALFRERLSSTQFYEEIDNADKRYFFWKYENYLRDSKQPVMPPMGETELLLSNPRLRMTIEHIACQNPKVTTEELHLPELTEEFKKTYLHNLGNLTLDPNSANASKNNNNIEVKNSKYFVKATLKTQNELEEYMTEEGKWTEESIRLRAEKIIEFALRNWSPARLDVPVVSEEEIEAERENSPHREEHKQLMRAVLTELTAELSSISGVKPARNPSVSQSKDGYTTYIEVHYPYHESQLLVELAIDQEEEGDPFGAFISIAAHKKSETLSYKMNEATVRVELEEEDYEDISRTDSKPEFQKALGENVIDAKIFTSELPGLKVILTKILKE